MCNVESQTDGQIQWLPRASIMHDALRELINRSGEKSHSEIFLETAILLMRLKLTPKPVEPDCNWRGWSKAQLDFIWAVFGSREPRQWSFTAALIIAQYSGELLLKTLRKANRVMPSEAHEVAAFLVAEQAGLIRRNQTGRYEAVPIAPEPEPNDKIIKAGGPIMHRSQKIVFERCVELGQLHFSGKTQDSPLRPRCDPLIIGPTGVGKTNLARAVAKALDSYFLPVTYGRWIPNGGKGTPTMFVIMEALKKHERVTLFFDELCKLGSKVDCSWTRSVFNEVFYALDREFPLEDFKRSKEVAGNTEPPDVKRLWVLGAGTWQHLTGIQTAKPALGFGAQLTLPSKAPDIVTQVRESDGMPTELLARFHCQPLVLSYPAADEIPELFSAYGLDRLAAQAGVDLSTVKLDFAQGGMRVFEALAADLMLKIQRQNKEVQLRE